MNCRKNMLGETLVEALVSLTILMVTTAVASSTVIYAMQSVALSKDYLVAQNLGNEAIEIVKNIRDTNLMINSTNKNKCWTVIHPTPEDSSTTCADNMDKLEVAPKIYIPILDTNNKWKLVKFPTAELNLNGGANNANYRIYRKTISTSPDPEVYIYSNDPSNPPPTGLTDTNFYRQIKVLEITTDTDSVLIEVKIQWFTGAKINELKGVTLITNHE